MTRYALKRMSQRVMLGLLTVGGMQQARAQGLVTRAVPTPGEPLTLYAVKYGESAYPAARLIKGDTSGKNLTSAWMFYAVKADREIVLVDTGFSDTNEASRSGVAGFRFKDMKNFKTRCDLCVAATREEGAIAAIVPAPGVLVNRAFVSKTDGSKGGAL